MMYIIYRLSNQSGNVSSALSGGVTYRLVAACARLMNKELSPMQILLYSEYLHFFIRKTAHVTEYFLLGVSVALPLYVYKVRGIYLILTAAVFCVGFAALDEFHQSFVAGRSAQSRDVLIDCIGIFPGIISCQILCFIGRKTIFAPLSLEKKKPD